jgi:hypothetical protein
MNVGVFRNNGVTKDAGVLTNPARTGMAEIRFFFYPSAKLVFVDFVAFFSGDVLAGLYLVERDGSAITYDSTSSVC